MPSRAAELDDRCINTIRFLAVDAVERAQSGHPGAPMGQAVMGYVLWDRVMKYNPRDPHWPNRDRFVLSAGHGSMLQYALLYLTGYDLTLEDIEQFRQWGSRTPGHPEYGLTPGVEVTTGPLGQGFGDAVGLAMAERHLACVYNRPGHEIVSHFTYVIASDGDMEEGVTHEVASLAGTLRLGHLIVLYDSNHISIEGDTEIAFTENVGARFAGYGWQVIGPINGQDAVAVSAALLEARQDPDRPTLIICNTIIGYGSPVQGTGKAHGEPMGAENARKAKETLGWPTGPAFFVPDDVLAHMRLAIGRGEEAERAWQQQMDAYTAAYPDLATAFKRQLRGEFPTDWADGLGDLFPADAKPMATRSASGKVINYLAPRIPALLGGSADLAPSTKTLIEGAGSFSAESYCGRNLHFGVREHGMGTICNGLARHGGILPYGATFLIFTDYMRPPMRLAALMKAHVIYVLTHDSIALGEDGPTHQPIEQLMNLRAVPNFTLIRPSDATETAYAWQAALQHDTGPTALVLTRQNLPVIDRTRYAPASGLLHGGYVLWESAPGLPDILLIATGSEVHLALEAAATLARDAVRVRVVSFPCWNIFDAQPAGYREEVLPSQVWRRVSIEAGTTLGWEHYLGHDGIAIGINHFGASAPGAVNYREFGFTADHVIAAAQALLARQRGGG